jgi:hypothetical protein
MISRRVHILAAKRRKVRVRTWSRDSQRPTSFGRTGSPAGYRTKMIVCSKQRKISLTWNLSRSCTTRTTSVTPMLFRFGHTPSTYHFLQLVNSEIHKFVQIFRTGCSCSGYPSFLEIYSSTLHVISPANQVIEATSSWGTQPIFCLWFY